MVLGRLAQRGHRCVAAVDTFTRRACSACSTLIVSVDGGGVTSADNGSIHCSMWADAGGESGMASRRHVRRLRSAAVAAGGAGATGGAGGAGGAGVAGGGGRGGHGHGG